MSTNIKAFLFAAILIAAPNTKAADWPLYFDIVTKDSYIMVVLHADGHAEYLQRIKHREGNVWLLHDATASWGRFEGELAKGPKGSENIWVKTKQYRMDYYLEPNRLIEHDKMGVQNILIKRQNTNHP